MAVPYTFGNATTSIPLSQLDTNFATAITIGNTAVYLGNTTTTFGNVTLNNVTINSGNSTVSSESISGNLTFTSTGNRILGDFSNATVANRVSFQDSTTNNGTYIQTLPNGTSQGSGVIVFNNSTPTNAAFMALTADATTAQVNSSITGTGTYLPMTFRTGGSERMRIDTSGNVGIGGNNPGTYGKFGVIGAGYQATFVQSSDASGVTAIFAANSSSEARIGTASNHPSTFYTNATERMRIDSSGNVGIGTASPGYKLDIQSSSATFNLQSTTTTSLSYLTLRNVGYNYVGVENSAGGGLFTGSSAYALALGTVSAYPIQFGTSGTIRATIDSSGNVGIGTSSPINIFDVVKTQNGVSRMSMRNLSNGNTAYTVINVGNDTSNQLGEFLATSSTNNGGFGANAVVLSNYTANPLILATNNTERMRIDSSGNVGIGTSSPSTYGNLVVNFSGSSKIVARESSTGYQAILYADGGAAFSGAVSNIPYLFLTNNTERARIDTSGRVLIGTTSAYNGRLSVGGSGQSATFYNTAAGQLSTPAVEMVKIDNNTTTSQTFLQFFINSGANGSGQINANGANTAAFGSFSDKRLKENIVNLPPQLENICTLRPVEFDYKDGSGHQIGFVAQEMQEVYPDVVGVGADDMLTITGWSKTEARLVKAIQELKAELDALKGTK